jgi:hypothetical protein
MSTSGSTRKRRSGLGSRSSLTKRCSEFAFELVVVQQLVDLVFSGT